MYEYKKRYSSPVTGLEWPRGFQEVKVPRFHDNGTGWWQGCQPYAPAAFSPRKFTWYSFLLEAETTPDHSATGRIMSLKNSSDTIGSRTRDLLVCSVVPETLRHRAPPCTSTTTGYLASFSCRLCVYSFLLFTVGVAQSSEYATDSIAEESWFHSRQRQ